MKRLFASLLIAIPLLTSCNGGGTDSGSGGVSSGDDTGSFAGTMKAPLNLRRPQTLLLLNLNRAAVPLPWSLKLPGTDLFVSQLANLLLRALLITVVSGF